MTEATPSQTTYSRVMLKISGEALMGETGVWFASAHR
jgi:uridylate kinase